jgi:PEP-CTERM motif
MNRSALQSVLTVACTVAVTCTARAQTTVNFDGFTGMPNSPGTLVPAASQLSTQLLSSGVRFSSLSNYIAVVVLGTGHATSGTLGVGGVTAGGALSYSAPILASFWDPANSATRGTTNFVQIRGDLIPISGTITMRVFDPLGALLATVTLPDAGGTTLTYNGANVHSVEITGTSGTVAFDDFQFGAVTAVAGSVVPEPTSLALVTGGTLLLGLARRRRARVSLENII